MCSRERTVEGHAAGALEGVLKRLSDGESRERHFRGRVRVYRGTEACTGGEALKRVTSECERSEQGLIVGGRAQQDPTGVQGS